MKLDSNGEEHKMFKKKWEANHNGVLDLVMKDIMESGHNISDLDVDADAEADELVEN